MPTPVFVENVIKLFDL